MNKQRGSLAFLKTLRTFLFLGLALCVGMAAQAQDWEVSNIGVTNPDENGSVVFDGTGATLVSPPSGDIWAGTDKFTFGYKAWTGDGSITARLDSTDMVYAWAKTGVMFRQSLDTNALMVDCVLTPGNGVALQDWVNGGAGSWNTGGITAPVTLRLDRQGDVFTAYFSKDDGVTWARVGTPQTIAMTNPVYVGLAGCANAGPGPYTTAFSDIQITAELEPVPFPVVTPAAGVYMGLFAPAAGTPTAKKAFTITNTSPGSTFNVSAVAATGTGYSVVTEEIKKNGVAATLPTAVGSSDVLEIPITYAPPATEGLYLGSATITADATVPTVNLWATVAQPSNCPVTDGMVFHVDSSSNAMIVENDGATPKLKRWGDLSGYGQDIRRDTVSVRPLYMADGMLNGKPAIEFDGTTGLWGPVDLTVWPRAEATVVFVAKCITAKDSFLFCFANSDFANRMGSHFPWSNNNVYWDFGNGNSGGRINGDWTTLGGDPMVDGQWMFQSSMKSSGQWVYANGTLVASDANASTFNPDSMGNFQMAYGADGTWNGDMYEMIIFNRKLTPGEMNDVGYYIQNKYALQGTYTEPSAKFTATPNVIDYGYAEPAAGKVTRDIVVKNDGSRGKDLTVSLTATLGAAYTIESVVRSSDPQPVAGNNYQTVLTVDDTLTIKVAFDPTKTAPAGTEGLVFTHNGNPAGTNETVDLFLFGRPGKPNMPPITDGLYLFAAVDNVTMARDGAPVWNWTDYSGTGHNMTLRGGSPTYIANAVNGKPVIRFSGEDAAYYRFTTCEDTRTVFLVLKEDASAAGDQLMAPVLGNCGPSSEWGGTTPDFCRGENKAIFNTNTDGSVFTGDFVHPQVKTAEVRVNGTVVNALTAPVPNSMSILSIGIKNPEWGAWADQIGRDRDNTTRAWKGDYAEVIIYNRELTAKEIQRMGVYLQNKYGIAGTFVGMEGPEMAVAPTSVDFGRVPKGVNPYTQTISVSNRGYGSPELEFSSIAVTGAANFNIESVTVNGDYVTTPAFATSLAGDSAERMEIDVSFASAAAGSFTGNLVLKSNDPTAPTLTIPLQAVVPDVWFDMTGAWNNMDIGAVGAAGSATMTPDKNNPTYFSVSGSGADIWNNADEFHFAYKQVTGDAEIVAQVDSHLFGTNTGWCKIGPMIRETLDAGSKHVFAAKCPASDDGGTNSIFTLQGRTTTGGGSFDAQDSGWGTRVPYTSHPAWLKIRRVGNLFYAEASKDGATWSKLSTNPVNVPMSATVYFGLAVGVGADGEMATAEFSNVVITSLESGDPIPTAYVKPVATGTGDGSSWANATADLAAAVGRVKSSGDGEVWMAAGVHNLTQVVELPANVAILGGFAGTETEAWMRDPKTNLTIVNQTGTNQRVFSINNVQNASLDGLVISGGNKTGTSEHGDAGGAVYVRYADATNAIRNCVFVNNSTKGWGGALSVFDGYNTFVVENCYFAGNQSGDNGGAVFSAWSGVTFLNCVFAGNLSAVDGAALGGNYHYTTADRAVDFVNCTFADNRALNNGIIYTFQNEYGPVTFTSSIVANNDFGGPLFFEGGAEVKRDTCLFFGNTTTTLEGAVTGGADVLGDPKFLGGVGGTWASVAAVAGTSTTVLTANASVFGVENSMVGKLINPNTTGTTQSLQSLIIANTANSVTIIGNVADAAAGMTFQVFDYALQTGSAAIDAGVLTDAVTDIRGVVRPDGTAFDIGAYEFAAAVPDYYGLTINEVGLGNVVVAPLAETYVAGTTVTLTAHPDAGQRLQAWSGDVPAGHENDNPLVITLDANKTITATFELMPTQTYTLTANVNPAEGGSVVLNPATGPYNQGTVVTATATPAAGYRLVNWTGDASGTAAAVQVTMNANKTITANFELIPTYTLTTNVAPVDFGTVTKVPDLPNYADGTQVQLTANPAAGKRFVNWTGDASGTNPVVTVTMNANKTVTANFEDIPAQFTLTVIINPVGAGTVVLDPTGGVYDAGTVVTLTETPNATYRFVNWTGDATGTAASAQVTMDGNKTVTANFELIPIYTLTLVADPANGGTVAKAPDLAGYEVGAQVTLTATPAEGFQFRGWVDGSTTVTSPYTMPAENKTLTAKFKPLLPDQYTVTVVADPVAGGSVSKAPDQATYSKDAVVTLTAAENTGYTFDGWYDGATQLTTEKTYAYTVAENKVFTAKFSAVLTYTLTLVADPANGGTVSKAPEQAGYEAGAQVTLTATPADGFQFRGWVDGSTTVTSPYTMPAENKTLTAKFKPLPVGTYTVSVVAEPLEGGTVSKAPEQATYSNGAQVTLTAAANAAYTFDGWYDGATQVSTDASYVYTVAGANKTFTAKFTAKAQYTLTVMADPSIGGTVSKTPDQATYLEGAAVTLTATAMTGYEFVGWYDGATLLSSLTSYAYTMPAANKSLTAKFELSGLPAPANVTASGNTFRVLLNWDSVTSATAYLIERTAVDSTHTLSWTVSAADALVGTGTNAFADDTASPAIPYAYVVTALDAQENLGTPSLPATATVMAEVFAAANYKVTCKGYTLVRSASNDLTFEPTIAGSNPGTIKIALLKKMPSNAVDNAAKGIYYLTSVTQVPMLRVNGSVKTLAFDVPVLALVVRDLAKSVSAKSVTFLTANEFGSISIAATKDSGAGLYARTFIQTTSAGTTPMSIKVTGAVVEEVGSTATTAQPIKLLNVASKTYKDAAKATRTSLGAIGSLPVVVNELQVGNTTSAPAEATPCSIQGSALKAITVSGGPLVADELVGAIDKVTVAGGNLRVGLIQSSKDLVLVQATAKKGVGGAVGTAGSPLALVVKGQPSSKGVAIGKVSAQTGVSGFFYAGYDAATGAPTKSGGINILQTKSGVVEGAAFLDPALVSKLKILPKTPVQPIVINPGS